MGYLHQGHLSLMEKGRHLCDTLVVSIFVNPTQFGPNEDLDAYPSNIENDLALAEKAGVTAVFLPHKNNMYPKNFQTEVSLQNLPKFLCGRFRPVHFAGVATVVTKLFNIVMPDMAVFGQKDYQQLQIIRQLCLDLDFDIQIHAGEIVREPDGLAMSSRNAYLSKSQRESALSLSQSLNLARDLVARGEKNPNAVRDQMDAFIRAFPGTISAFVIPEPLKTLSGFKILLSWRWPCGWGKQD
jgi:pantoate--beta-alanine ligase